METRRIKQVIKTTIITYVIEYMSGITKLVAVEQYVRLCNRFIPTYVGNIFLLGVNAD
jgi:hypothetical protein